MTGSRPAQCVTNGVPKERWDPPVALRLLFLLLTVTVFFISINMMGGALKLMTKSFVTDLLGQATENPVLGLLLGILTTSIIQSSSTTTSIVVTFAATGMISLRGAIPIIMGANIGTTVTNTLVSFAHARHKDEFENALAAGVVHDWFNILATLVLFPLEITTHVIEKSAVYLERVLVGTSFGKLEGLNQLIKPIVKEALSLCHLPWIGLLVSLLVLFMSLTMMVKIMRSIFLKKMSKVLDRFLFRNALSAFVVGIIFTVLVQSSSVTTSLIVPLVGAGILTLQQVFPYTLGANIGTTVTAFMAALALAAGAGNDPVVATGVTVAIVHLLFNISGIVLIYPIKAVPIYLARWLARHIVGSPKKAALFILLYLLAHVAPIVFFVFT